MLTLYTKTTCGFCVMAKSLLSNNGIEFQEVNVEHDADAMEFIKSKGHRSVPQIYHNGELFVEGGFTGLKEMGISVIKEKLEGIDTSELGSL